MAAEEYADEYWSQLSLGPARATAVGYGLEQPRPKKSCMPGYAMAAGPWGGDKNPVLHQYAMGKNILMGLQREDLHCR